MAVDLTTGSYDEEGIFNKHNAPSKSSEKITPVNDFCSLKNFRVLKVLKECSHKKTLVVEGRFVGDDRRAIIAIEKMPFDSRDLSRMFTSESRVELKFRNDIYAKYHVYPQNGFNGISIKVIHPANEKDFSKYVDEPVVMVCEMKILYDRIVAPHFKAMFQQQATIDVNSSNLLFADSSEDTKFVLLKEEMNDCTCANNHVRGKAIIQKPDLLSLRDLTSSEIPLLKKVKKACLEKMSKEYKIPTSQLECYVHYPPQTFPFQIIFESVERHEKIPVGKVHDLDYIISSLQLKPDYYQTVTLSYFISEKDPLARKIKELNLSTSNNK
ncbi:m7GpppX diphosphatase [Parasteatoda tepidariorum]|uniref:m7GpppX diphosphatase n=1 Tax=Parasteatoda tepidariorum TaxID=114398 RepID=UPI00077FB3FF|nr:m7GpppX diphosphatase [Parasteatoda tepidariorum]